MLRKLFVVEEKLIGQHFHEVRHDINYMLLLCIFLFCTGLSLQSKPEQSLKEQQGDRGAARMARRKWLLEKKVRRYFHNPLDSPGLMSRRRDGYLKRRFVIISTIPMAIAKIGCGPSNFHLQAIL